MSITFCANNTLFAQYSNASLNGPWFYGNISDANLRDKVMYFIFDGNGLITEWGGFGPNSGSNYSVTSSGSITGTIYADGNPVVFSGQLNSSTTGTLTVESETEPIIKVDNPGALTDSLIGVIDATPAGCSQKNVTICINSQGQVISALGLLAPVSGRVYANSGIFIGHIKTGDNSPCGTNSSWDGFSISGTYTNDSLNGILDMDCGNVCNLGISQLIRRGAATGIAPITTLKPALFVYPNPAVNIVNLNISNITDESFEINIYTVMGVLVRSEMLKQNHQQINITDLCNGLYMVTAKSKDFTENKRMVIQR